MGERVNRLHVFTLKAYFHPISLSRSQISELRRSSVTVLIVQLQTFISSLNPLPKHRFRELESLEPLSL